MIIIRNRTIVNSRGIRFQENSVLEELRIFCKYEFFRRGGCEPLQYSRSSMLYGRILWGSAPHPARFFEKSVGKSVFYSRTPHSLPSCAIRRLFHYIRLQTKPIIIKTINFQKHCCVSPQLLRSKEKLRFLAAAKRRCNTRGRASKNNKFYLSRKHARFRAINASTKTRI